MLHPELASLFDAALASLAAVQTAPRISYPHILNQCIDSVVRLLGYRDVELQRVSVAASASNASLDQDIQLAIGCGNSIQQKEQVSKVKTICNSALMSLESNGELIHHLLVLVDGVNNLLQDADSHVLAFFASCLARERHNLTNLGDSASHSEVEDIIKLINASEPNISMAHSKVENDVHKLTPNAQLLGFVVSDPELNRIFHLVLNVIVTHNVQDMYRSSRALWETYTRLKKIVRFEVLNFSFHERKLALFNQFFMHSNSTGWKLLPSQYDDISNVVISAYSFLPYNIEHPTFDPQNRKDNIKVELIRDDIPAEPQNLQPPSSSVSTASMGTFSRSDRAVLVGNLRQLVPILKEYKINISESFPSLLKFYFDSVYEEVPESLLVDDYKYVTNLVRIVNQIVDFENNEETSDKSIDVLLNDLVNLHDILVLDVATSTIIMRLARYEWVKALNLRKQYIERWNKKLLSVCQLDLLCNDTVMQQLKIAKLKYWLGVWYGKTIRFDRLSLEVHDYYQLKLLLRYFIGKVIGKVEKLVNEDDIATNFQLKKYISRWKSKMQTFASQELQAVENYDSNLVRKYLEKILENASNSQSKSTILDEEERTFKMRYDKEIKDKVFKAWLAKATAKIVPGGNWRGHSSTVGEKLKYLADTERFFVRKKYFYKWRRQQYFFKKSFQVKRLHGINLMKYCFSLWHLKFRMISESEKFLVHKDLTFSKLVLKYWIQQKDLGKMADKFFMQQSLRKNLKAWEKAYRINQAKDAFERKIKSVNLSLYFKNWKLQCMARNMHNNDSRFFWFTSWKNKTDKFISQKSKAVILCDKKLYSLTTNLWYSKVYKHREMHFTADNFVKRKVLAKISTKISNLRELELIVRGSGPRDFDLWVTLKSCFILWSERYRENFRRMSELKIRQFEHNYVVPNLMRRKFGQWVAKYNESLRRREHLDVICYNYLSSHPMRRDYFEKWLSLMIVNAELNERALEFERIVVLKRFLLIYYDQFMKKLVYLDDIAENFIAQRDHEKSAEIVRSWSMKYIMGIQRNNESCKLFIERWTISKLKSIFDLWIYKTREELDNGAQYNSDPNTSIISNLSPLSKKYYASLVNRSSSKNGGFLFTPLKGHSPKVDTPINSHETSPSKLQETTQRLKAEKINRLRERYRNAKINSPPRSESIFNARSLTPQKMTHSQSPLDINNSSSDNDLFRLDLNSNFIRLSPPKIRGLGSVVYNSFTEDDSPSTAQTVKPEKEVLTLRRITPITFPLNDDLGSPRFSPLAKINDRRLLKSMP